MQRFKTFLKEADSSGATNMEKYIVIAYNGGYDKAPDTYGITKKEYNQHKDIAEKIASDIKKKTKARQGSMIHFGAGVGKMITWWKGKPTPKTDLYSTDGKTSISLKQSGGSQLMSALPDETKSTFKAAIDYMGANSPEEIQKLLNELEPTLKEMIVTGPINDFKETLKSGKIPKKIIAPTTSGKQITIKVDKDKFQAEMNAFKDWQNSMKKIQPIVTQFLEDNPEFKMWMVFEAATGETKFQPDAHAKANWIVSFDPTTGEDNMIMPLSKGDGVPSEYIKSVAKHSKIRISPKTPTGSKVQSTGVGVTSTSFRIDVSGSDEKKIKKDLNIKKDLDESITFQSMLQESTNEFYQQLNEELLTEFEFLQKIKDWVINTFNKIWNYIVELAQEGLDAILNFFEYEPDVVGVTGDILMFYTED